MLNFILMLLFMIPLCFFNTLSWWVVQFIFFLIVWIFMSINLSGGIEGLGYMWGFDLLSYGLVLLSFWVCSLIIIASASIYHSNYYNNLFVFIIIFLILMLLCAFSSIDILSFYIFFFFEGSLIPTLLLILGWGYQPERVQAGIYLLFYTLLASLPLLISLLVFYGLNATLSLYGFWSYEVNNVYVYISIIIAFLVKMPIFLFHLWLPKAHVEAPISGSIVLAGVLLKLGGYGLIWIFSIIVSCLNYNFVWISISLVGGFLISLVCLRQVDLNSLIAYSSVVHMGMVLGGLITLNSWGFCGCYMMMIGHGLCSSGLFCLSNIAYERLGSRSLIINKGLICLMPSLALWWFLLSSSNIAAPPSLNLLAEISLINSLMAWNYVSMFLIALISFFSVAYSLYIFSYSQHGENFSGSFSYIVGYFREYELLFLHWFPLNVLILRGDYFFSCI